MVAGMRHRRRTSGRGVLRARAGVSSRARPRWARSSTATISAGGWRGRCTRTCACSRTAGFRRIPGALPSDPRSLAIATGMGRARVRRRLGDRLVPRPNALSGVGRFPSAAWATVYEDEGDRDSRPAKRAICPAGHPGQTLSFADPGPRPRSVVSRLVRATTRGSASRRAEIRAIRFQVGQRSARLEPGFPTLLVFLSLAGLETTTAPVAAQPAGGDCRLVIASHLARTCARIGGTSSHSAVMLRPLQVNQGRRLQRRAGDARRRNLHGHLRILPPARHRTRRPAFRATWTGRPLSDLFDFVREKMPKNDPASLTPGEYAQVVAYILKINDAPAGEHELPSEGEALKKIRIELTARPVKRAALAGGEAASMANLRRTDRWPSNRNRRIAIAVLGIGWRPLAPVPWRSLASNVRRAARARARQRAGEWRYWGADAWSTRYSPLDQINASNFSKLQDRVAVERRRVRRGRVLPDDAALRERPACSRSRRRGASPRRSIRRTARRSGRGGSTKASAGRRRRGSSPAAAWRTGPTARNERVIVVDARLSPGVARREDRRARSEVRQERRRRSDGRPRASARAARGGRRRAARHQRRGAARARRSRARRGTRRRRPAPTARSASIRRSARSPPARRPSSSAT